MTKRTFWNGLLIGASLGLATGVAMFFRSAMKPKPSPLEEAGEVVARRVRDARNSIRRAAVRAGRMARVVR